VEAILRERLARLSLEQKIRLLTGADFWSLHPEPAIGLRRVVLSDGHLPVEGLRAALGTGVRVDHGLGVRSTDRFPVAPWRCFGRAWA
jgi:hypothetical protein